MTGCLRAYDRYCVARRFKTIKRLFGRSLSGLLVRYRYGLTIVVYVVLTAPLGVASRPLWVGDETREAAIANEMADSGRFFETRLAGHRITEKPPFFYASVASSIRLGKGATPVSTRLPSVFFSALTLLCASAAASLLFSSRAGLYTCVILSTTYLFVVNAHDCVVDVSLAAFVSLGLLAFTAASRKAGFPRWDSAFGLAASCALLAKGFVGPVLLLLLTVPFWILSPVRRRLSASVSGGVWLVLLSALLLWTGATYAWGGLAALREAFWNQQAGRFLGFPAQEYSHHRSPFYFYLVSLPGMLFPWVITLPAAAKSGIRERGRPSSLAISRPLIVGMVLALLFLSAAGTKRTIYFLPVVPVAAILIASFLDRRLLPKVARFSRILWIQFSVIALAAVAMAVLPAVENRRLTLREGLLGCAVAIACAAVAGLARRSPQRLVGASLIVAVGAIVLLDRASLPRLDHDRSAKEFFARVRRHLAPEGHIYSFRLNEDVLGRACLDLHPRPIAENDPARLGNALNEPQAFLLAESAAVEKRGLRWALSLESVEEGRAGNRGVGLYRARSSNNRRPLSVAVRAVGRGAVGGSFASRQLALREFSIPFSTRKAKALANAVWKKEAADQNRQKNRRDDGRDLCPRCLANPEGPRRDEFASDQEALSQEVQDERESQAEQDAFPLAREANRVVDAAAKQQTQGRPEDTIDERRAQVAQDESPEVHPCGAGGEEDDRPKAVEIAREKEKPIPVTVERSLNLLDFLGRKDLFHESVSVQASTEECSKPVENRVGDDDPRKLGGDHEGEARDSFED